MTTTAEDLRVSSRSQLQLTSLDPSADRLPDILPQPNFLVAGCNLVLTESVSFGAIHIEPVFTIMYPPAMSKVILRPSR